jgi:SAM-dependent methyltransferase
MQTTDETAVDDAAVEAFAGRLVELFTGAALTALIHIGHRSGLFEAARLGPATSGELADRAGRHERYVREWLAALATARVFEYDPDTRRFWLPREHAACLVGDGVDNLAPLARLTTMLTRHVDAVGDAFRDGGGVPYAAYVPEIHDVMDALWGPMYRELLVPAILPLADGLPDRLRDGGRVADVACGTGNSLIVLAAEYPASTFVGVDHDGAAIARARAAATARGLTNVTFREGDAAHLDAAHLDATHLDAADLGDRDGFDAVLVFNALHDQAAPDAVLRAIHGALRPGGVLLLDEPRLSERLEDNIGHPLAPFTYAVSTLHCLTVCLAEGGVGLGTALSERRVRDMLAAAGFGEVAVHDAPGDPGNAVYVTTRPPG